MKVMNKTFLLQKTHDSRKQIASVYCSIVYYLYRSKKY